MPEIRWSEFYDEKIPRLSSEYKGKEMVHPYLCSSAKKEWEMGLALGFNLVWRFQFLPVPICSICNIGIYKVEISAVFFYDGVSDEMKAEWFTFLTPQQAMSCRNLLACFKHWAHHHHAGISWISSLGNNVIKKKTETERRGHNQVWTQRNEEHYGNQALSIQEKWRYYKTEMPEIQAGCRENDVYASNHTVSGCWRLSSEIVLCPG